MIQNKYFLLLWLNWRFPNKGSFYATIFCTSLDTNSR